MAGIALDVPDIDSGMIDNFLKAGRYMSAYRPTAHLWGAPELAGRLDADQLVTAARLACNLGNGKWCRWLLRLGGARFPDHGGIALYSAFYAPRREHPLDRLRELEHLEDHLPTDDPALQAGWLCLAATNWAAVRDMARAYRLLDQAEQLGGDIPYTFVARTQVLLLDDAWEEAVESAERAWVLAPGRASVAGTLGRVLSRAGRVEEAAARLGEVAARLESYEVAILAIRYALCMAEHSGGAAREDWRERARSLTDALPSLMPLADRESLRMLDHVRFDVAHFNRDRDALGELAASATMPFLRSLAEELLERLDQGIKALPITPMRQKHNTCLPTALGSLLGGRGHAIDVEALVREVSYGGTASWRAMAWLEQRGIHAHPILLNREIATALIEAGHTFILITSNVENAHAMTAFGLDYAADCLLVHDPAGLRWVRFNLKSFTDFESPLGPEGILVGTREEVECALRIVPADCAETARLYHEYGRALEVSGADSADAARRAIEKAFPQHPLAWYVRALQLRNLGRGREAVKLLTELLRRYPRCERLQVALLSVLGAAGDVARERAALAEIVEGARLPGIQLDQQWRNPPATFVLQYAQLLSRSEDKIPKALRLLRHAVAMNPSIARGYYGIGMLLHRTGALEASLLPLRVAASLEPEDELFARLYMHVLGRLGREEEGFTILRERAERLSTAERGAEAWTALVSAYESSGYPGRANAQLAESIAAFPHNEILLAYAVQFWSDTGEWERAAAALERLAADGHSLLHLRSATHFHLRRGDRARAKQLSAAWIKESPLSDDARRMQLTLVTLEQGQTAGVALIRSWMKQQPDNEHLEQIIYDVYRRLHDAAAIDALVDRCIERDPDDAWAWRERAICLIKKMQGRAPAARKALEARLREALDACARTCPEDVTTLIVRARHTLLEGRHADAVAQYLEALSREPDMLHYVEELGDVIPRLSKEERRALFDRLEALLLQTPGPLAAAWEVSVLIAVHQGFAEAWASLQRWGASRGRDPRLIEASANILMSFGAGKSDARRALDLLRDGVDHFPAEPELRHLIARCLGILEETGEEEAAYRELVRRAPADLRPRLRLAHLLEVDGKEEEALALLESCLALAPSDPGARDAHAQFLWNHGRPLEAIGALEEALALIPESISLRERLVDCHANMGNIRQAMQALDEGLERFPDGAYLWYLRGTVLQRGGQARDFRPIEECFRKALALNASMVDACDALAVLLCETRRHQEARQVLQDHREHVADDTPLRGRIAWVRYEQGDEDGAIREMARLVRDEPLYGWGWRMLIAWIDKGHKRDQAVAVLPGIHTALPGDAFLRGFALDTLTRLQDGHDPRNADWTQLLADFPRDLSIHMMRVDALLAARNFPEARSVLEAARKYHAASPYLCARDVQLRLADGQIDAALQSARMVWTHPADDTEWPEGTTWNALADAGLDAQAVEIIQSAIGADYRVGRTAFLCMCGHLERTGWDLWGRGRFWRNDQSPSMSVWLPGKPARRLLHVLRQLDTVSWEADEHRAIVLHTLNDMGYGRSVYRWYRQNEYRVENSPMLWEAAGIALVRCWPRFKYWLPYFESWRDRPGVQLRFAAFYVIALQHSDWGKAHRRAHAEKMHEHARDALERLPHDHTARYLACVVAGTYLQLGHWRPFAEFMERHGELIRESGDGDGFLAAARYTHVPEVLGYFKSLILTPAPGGNAVHALSDKLGRIIAQRTCPSWASDAWHRCIAAHHPEARFNRRLWWGLRRFYQL